MTGIARILLAIVLFSIGVLAQHHDEAPAEPQASKSEKTELVDEFGKLGHCDTGSRFDAFFAQLSERPDSVGYFITYQAVDVLPVYYKSGPMERMFRNHMTFRNFDSSRVVVVNGGFRDEVRTQLWIVPAGGEVPSLMSDAMKPPVLPTSKTFLFDYRALGGEDYNELEEFELPSVKEQREREASEFEAEAAQEAGTEDAVPAEPAPEPIAEAGDPVAEEEYVDTRTPEEIEAERFSWVSESFGEMLLQRKDSTGVLMFYADDETFDTGRLTAFVEEGKARLAKLAGIDVKRLSVRFGGYRAHPAVEFWIVPRRGKAPVATPEERLKEGEDGAEPGHSH